MQSFAVRTKKIAEDNLLKFSESDESENPEIDLLNSSMSLVCTRSKGASVQKPDLLTDTIPLGLTPAHENASLEGHILDDSTYPADLELPTIEATTAPEIDLFADPEPAKPLKPVLPYRVGWAFQAQAHISSGATFIGQDWLTSDNMKDLISEMNVLQRAQMQRPYPRGTYGEVTLNLHIRQIVSVGENQRAQIFTVTVNGPSNEEQYAEMGLPSQTRLLARVFDPVYFDDAGGRLDPFFCSDFLYSNEVWAYKQLRDLQGAEVLRYHGSFSITLSSRLPGDDNEVEREVRMILLEIPEGSQMADMEAGSIPSHERQKIIRDIMVAESKVYQRDVALLELAPKNVVLDLPKGGLKILVDLTNVFEKRDVYYQLARTKRLRFRGQWISPLLHWNERPLGFSASSWIDWDWKAWIEKEFADSKDAIAQDMLDAFPECEQTLRNVESNLFVDWLFPE